MSEYEEFKGKTIKSIRAARTQKDEAIIEIQLDNEQIITIGIEGGGGADGGWYEWLIMRVNGNIAERL